MSNPKSTIFRIVIVLMIIYMIFSLLAVMLLGRVGEAAEAQITSVYRDSSKNRNHAVYYRFKTVDGETISGSFPTNWPSQYEKKGAPTTVAIRYLKTFPQFNKTERECAFSFKHFFSLFIGVVLILTQSHEVQWRVRKKLNLAAKKGTPKQ